MGSVSPPDKDSPDLHLVVATQEELIAQQHANSEEWRGALSLDAYLRREIHLYNQELTKDGGLTPWMLVYQPDPDGPRQVLCGCETMSKKAITHHNRKVEDVTCHAVCSVFCPLDRRGRGYAGRMMTDLGNKLKTWQSEKGTPVLFSVLYSDIGKDFYAARGWQPFPSAHISLPASASEQTQRVRLLNAKDLGELCTLDEEIIRKQLAQMPAPGKHTVAIIPDVRTFDWHHAREDFVGQELHGKIPAVKGAIVGDIPGSRVWAYFTRVWANPHEEAPSTLHILRLVVEDESLSDFAPATPEAAERLKSSDTAHAIASIFAVAQAEASHWDMKEVLIWNPTSATLAAARSIDPNAAVTHRETESITSLQWYESGSSWQDVDWICNEKYGWC